MSLQPIEGIVAHTHRDARRYRRENPARIAFCSDTCYGIRVDRLVVPPFPKHLWPEHRALMRRWFKEALPKWAKDGGEIVYECPEDFVRQEGDRDWADWQAS